MSYTVWQVPCHDRRQVTLIVRISSVEIMAQITIQFKVTSILPLCNILCHEVDSSIIILKTTEEYLQTGRNRAQ